MSDAMQALEERLQAIHVEPGHLEKRMSTPRLRKSRESEASLPDDDLDIKGTVVLDNGTGVIKAGLAGPDEPSVRVSNIVGWKQDFNKLDEKGEPAAQHLFLGDEAQARRAELKLQRPLEHGAVTNWDHMERLWDYVLEEKLFINVEEYSVLLTEPPMNAREHREKMAEIIFESFNAPALFVGMQALLALYSEGLTTGLVLDIGDGVTHIVPVYEGYGIASGVLRQDIAGRDLSEYMARLLREGGYFFNTSSQLEVVREIKEKLCYVAQDFNKELAAAQSDPSKFQKEMTLPDGQTITLGDPCFRCPEVLFQPVQLGKDLPSLPELLVSSVRKCPIDTRKPLLSSLLLSGGTTMFPGFPQRIQNGVASLLTSSLQMSARDLHVLAPKNRQDLVWRGGSVLASLSTFEDMLVTWEEYDECGPSIMATRALDVRNS